MSYLFLGLVKNINPYESPRQASAWILYSSLLKVGWVLDNRMTRCVDLLQAPSISIGHGRPKVSCQDKCCWKLTKDLLAILSTIAVEKRSCFADIPAALYLALIVLDKGCIHRTRQYFDRSRLACSRTDNSYSALPNASMLKDVLF